MKRHVALFGLVALLLSGCSGPDVGVSYDCSESDGAISCTLEPSSDETADYYVSYELRVGGVVTRSAEYEMVAGVTRSVPAILRFPIREYESYEFSMSIYSAAERQIADISLSRGGSLGKDVMSCMPFEGIESCTNQYDQVCAIIENEAEGIKLREYRTFNNACLACTAGVNGEVIGYKAVACDREVS